MKEDGSLCGARALAGSSLCYFHDPARADDRKDAQRAGGRANRPAVTLAAPRRPLKNAADVAALVAETIHHVRRGELDMKAANSVGFLSGVLLKALEQAELEDQLLLLEGAVSCSAGPDRNREEFSFKHLVGPMP